MPPSPPRRGATRYAAQVTTSSAPEDRSLLIACFAGKAFGLDRRTGAVRWRTELEGYGAIELAVGGGWVVACTSSHLHFVEYLTGRLASSVPHTVKRSMRPVMVIDEGQILVGLGGEVVAYSTSGEPLWSQPFKGEGIAVVALGLPGNVRQADDTGAR